ncbi:MAG: hypothetical protein ACREB7_14385 [Sphingopyxis sp.]|uniref:hypothetical protein n=1 Tax=Sphingopyxis sp. TaxID=1908224 RepID=UPI003D6D5262
MHMLPKIMALALLAACVQAVPAAAQTTAYAAGQGSPNQIVLSIPVTASVGGRCAFATGGAPSGTYDQPNFDVIGLNHDFTFALECTGPSRVAVVSTNGGLKTAGSAPTGYSTLAPYDVTLNLVGSSATANQTCQVATLVTGSTCTFLGPASTAQGLRLASNSINQTGTYLRVSAPPYAGATQLVSGNYADTLTVTVSASP